MANLYDKLKLDDLTYYKGPNDDGGAALVLRFKNNVEFSGKELAIPLEPQHAVRLMRLVGGHFAEQCIQEMDRMIIRPGELGPAPLKAFRKLPR